MSQHAWKAVEFLVWVGLGMLLDVLLQGAAGIPKGKSTPAGSHATQLAIAGLVGFGVGVVSAIVFPERFLARGGFPGVSVIILPAILAVVMYLWGLCLAKYGRPRSALATWYGGAILGVTLAAGRLFFME